MMVERPETEGSLVAESLGLGRGQEGGARGGLFGGLKELVGKGGEGDEILR